MQTVQAIKLLQEQDAQSRYVFAKRDLSKILNNESQKTFDETLSRLVKENILIRAARGVYVYAQSRHLGESTIDHVIVTLRRGEYSYVSLETATSQWGLISQAPIDLITVMTTGRKGTYSTPWGRIEFTHTKRDPQSILNNTTLQNNSPLRIATEDTAVRDLRRVGRNTNMMTG